MSKIALLLAGKKGYEVLKAVIFLPEYKILTDVVSTRDDGVDNDFYQEISELCAKSGISFHERLSKTFSPESYDGYLIAVGWRWLLPSGKKNLIIHDSILPEYRGFSPLVNSLINGENKIGATVLYAAEDYDRGEIVAQSTRPISYPITISEAIVIMSEIYVQMVRDLFLVICAKQKIHAVKQDESKATYSLWRDKDDYWIDWSWDSDKVERFINAVGLPYAGARTHFNNEYAIIHSAQSVEDVDVIDRSSAIGKVIFLENKCPIVVCGKGLLKITDIRSFDGKFLIPLEKFRTRFCKN